MTSYLKSVWVADPSKAERLSVILKDPTFIEAVALSRMLNMPTTPKGPTAITDAALEAARQAGMADQIEELVHLSKLSKGENDKAPPKRRTPWGHVTEEKSPLYQTKTTDNP